MVLLPTSRSYTIQMELDELSLLFDSEEDAKKWFEKNIWPDGRKCPRCGGTDTRETNHKSMPYYCAGRHGCKRRFSVRTGTVMEASNISYWKWAVATSLFATSHGDVTRMKVIMHTRVNKKTAWLLAMRLRESWRALKGLDAMEDPSKRKRRTLLEWQRENSRARKERQARRQRPARLRHPAQDRSL